LFSNPIIEFGTSNKKIINMSRQIIDGTIFAKYK